MAKCTQCWGSLEQNRRLNGKGRQNCYDCTGLPNTKEWNKYRKTIGLYDVDKSMWEAMYFDQNGTCLICDEREAAVVDHCHETQKVRGLLCWTCNKHLSIVEKYGLGRIIDYMAGDLV